MAVLLGFEHIHILHKHLYAHSVCTCIHAYTCTHTYILYTVCLRYTYVSHTDFHTRMYACLHSHQYMHTHTHTHICTHPHIHTPNPPPPPHHGVVNARLAGMLSDSVHLISRSSDDLPMESSSQSSLAGKEGRTAPEALLLTLNPGVSISVSRRHARAWSYIGLNVLIATVFMVVFAVTEGWGWHVYSSTI